jgi:oligosaccharide repeat unit polymerase
MQPMWIDLVLVTVMIVAARISRQRYRDIFTPLCLYVSMWCLCLLLFRLRLINYPELNGKTEWLIGGSMVAFVGGCLAAGRLKSLSETTLEIRLDRLESAMRILLILNFIGILVYLKRIQGLFGLSSYLTDPSVIRTNFDELSRIGWVAVLTLLNYPLFSLSLVHYLTSKRLRLISAIGMILPCIQSYIQTDRISLAILLFSGSLTWVYFNRWNSVNRQILRIMALLSILMVSYFIGAGYLYGKLVSERMEAFGAANFDETPQFAMYVIDPYIYATGSFPTFQEAMNDVHDTRLGARTFFPVARLLYALDLLRDRPEGASMEVYNIPVPINTTTYLFSFYEDFGTLGVILFPFFLGWLQTRLYLRLKKWPTFFSLTGTAGFVMTDLLSTFISLITTINVWYFLAVVYVVSRHCTSERGLSSTVALAPAGNF